MLRNAARHATTRGATSRILLSIVDEFRSTAFLISGQFLSSQDFDSDELIKLESLARLELVIAAKLGAKLV